MRKLTKKISMLMVLAMLVGLFSGVVSASAASKWSFKSADGDWDVAVGATINLDQDKYENFDLYKSGVLADEATYTITWESSDEKAVWVNAKSGQLRAKKDAADGAEAVITANIVNNTNKATHKVSFTIVVGDVEEPVYTLQPPKFEETVAIGTELKFSTNVLDEEGNTVSFKKCGLYREYFLNGEAIGNTWTAEKSGTYTITVGAFKAKADMADLENAVDEATFEVVVAASDAFELAQKSMNKFDITFDVNKDLSKLNKDNVIVYQAATLDGFKVKQFVKAVSTEKNVLTVELYNNLAKDNFVIVEIGDETNAFQVVKGDVATVVIKAGKVLVNTKTDLDIKLYDQFGIDITTADLLGKVSVEKVSGSENSVLDGKSILFWAKDKSTVVKAIYHTYTYKDGKEVAYESNSAEMVSVDSTAAFNSVTDWVVTTETNKDKIVWNGANRIALGDTGRFAIGKMVKTTTGVTSKDDTVITHGQGFTFDSSDKAILIVGANGALLPISKGSADIIVKSGNDIKGVFTVEVVDARKATTMSVTANKTVISPCDTVELTLDIRDQYGDAFNADTVEVKDIKSGVPTNYPVSNGKITLTANGATENTTFYRSIKTGDAIAYFEYAVKKLDGGAVSYAFDAETIALNTTIATNTDKTFGELYGDKVIKVLGYDKNGMLTATASNAVLEKVNSVSSAVTGATLNSFVATVTASKAEAKTWANTNVTVGAGGITFKYVDSTSKVITKAPADTYVISLYQVVKAYEDSNKVQWYSYNLCDTVVVSVEDAQKAYAVEVKGLATTQVAADVRAVSGTAFETAIGEVFKITYGDTVINANTLTVDEPTKKADYVVGDGTTIIFKKANIVTSFNFKGAGETYTLAETVYFPTTPITGK